MHARKYKIERERWMERWCTWCVHGRRTTSSERRMLTQLLQPWDESVASRRSRDLFDHLHPIRALWPSRRSAQWHPHKHQHWRYETNSIGSICCGFKPAFHDTDIDTPDTPISSRGCRRGCRCLCCGMRALLHNFLYTCLIRRCRYWPSFVANEYRYFLIVRSDVGYCKNILWTVDSLKY